MWIIRSILGEFHSGIIKILRNKSILDLLDEYLVGGVYRSSVSYDCIYYKRNGPVLSGKTFSSKDTKNTGIKNKINVFLSSYCHYNVHNKGIKLFEGTEVLISSSQTEYKVFDYTRHQVLTLYNSREKMKAVNANKLFFEDCFNIPKTISYNDNCSYVIEELIKHEAINLEEAVVYIGNEICDYFYSHREAFYSNEELFDEQCSLFENRFGRSVLLHEKAGSIVAPTHGDLWSSNVIYNGEKYYVTDFERVGERYFLFDFFTFIFSEWLLNSNSILIENYFSGCYDGLLNRMFSSTPIRFEKDKKNEYILSFLVAITYERWRNYSVIDEAIQRFINTYTPTYK